MATFADKPTLRGERVVLRPLAAGDVDDLLALLEDAETRRLTGTHDIFTHDEIALWCVSRADQRDRLDFAIVAADDGAWLGECAVNDWSPQHRSCNLRLALTPGATGKGLGREALRLLIDYVFTQLPIDRIGLDVYAFNARALHVFSSLGFAREGVLRGALRDGDGNHDVVIMGLLAYEWQQGPYRLVPAAAAR